MTKRSKPSSPPPSRRPRATSTISWTNPEPTDVLSYVYLWSHEAEAGRDEGSKERPVVVVLATAQRETGLEVIVAPVTTQPPKRGAAAVEMPEAVRARLGLGDKRCWIVAHELNRFLWRGPDVRPARRGGDTSPFYGKIPGKLLEQVREAMRRVGAGRLKVTKRSE